MMANATQATAKSEKLLETVFLNKLESPENSLKTALDMQERGRKDAMEMWRLIEDARGDRDNGDVIDPEGGFFGNFGNLILHGLKSLVSGAARGGGKQAMELLSGILQKPAGTTQFTEQDLQLAAQKIAATRRPAIAALPPPAPVPGQRPAQQQVNMPAAPPPGQPVRVKPKIFSHVYEIVDAPVSAPMTPATILTPPPSAAVQAPAATPTPAPAPIPVVEVEITRGTMLETENAPVIKQVQGTVVETTGDDYVNEGIAMAIADLKVGRREHEWVDFALGKWTRDFLTQLAHAPDDSARIQILQSQADPGLFQELVELLMDANKPVYYRDFIENLTALREGAMEGQLNAAA
jgi:hypothetical protein